ncbi:MAG: MFS transporter [Chloroflexi bacterium]|nr:MAG: MFS transporter [Chloroflexota bacterium]
MAAAGICAVYAGLVYSTLGAFPAGTAVFAHASDAFIGLLLTVQSITSMLVYPLLPRTVRRLGNRTLLALSALLIALYPLLTATIFTLEPLLVVSVVGGVGGAMFGLGSFNLLLEVTPQVHRPSFIATYNAAVNSAGFVAPFVGTALLNVIDINADLLLGGVFRLIGLLAVVLMVGISGEREVARV